MAQSTDAVTNTFRTLADPVRRYVLDSLDEQETPVSFDRLATRVAAWHTDSHPDAVDGATRTGMRTALFSCAACERTYISDAMDGCSKCGESVTKSRPSVNYPRNQSRMTGPPNDRRTT